MHMWGDKWFAEHGDDLHSAIDFCITNMSRWGRINMSLSKEKFGCFRDNALFWEGTIQSIIFPDMYYAILPTIYHKFELPILAPLLRYMGVVWLVQQYQRFIYNLVIQKVCKKYPEIIHEMVRDLDFPQYIKPGFFGNVDGSEIRNKYWRNIGE